MGGPGRRGGRDGGRGRGGQRDPLPRPRAQSHARRPNSRNSTLATRPFPPLPCTPAPFGRCAPPPPTSSSSYCCRGPSMLLPPLCRCGIAIAILAGGQPLVDADRAASRGPRRRRRNVGTGGRRRGARPQTTQSPCPLRFRRGEGKGLTAPTPHPLPFTIVLSPG